MKEFKPIIYEVIDNLDHLKIYYEMFSDDVYNCFDLDAGLNLIEGINVIQLGIRFLDDFNFTELKCCINHKIIKPVEIKLVRKESGDYIILNLSGMGEVLPAYEGISIYFVSNSHYITDNVPTPIGNSTLEFIVDHPYCIGEVGEVWSDVDTFLKEWGDSDVDYNQLVRWDMVRVKVDVAKIKLVIFKQRKETIEYHTIESVSDKDIPRFKEYLSKHWGNLRAMWTPISDKETK